jgi:hypothetical protein
MVLIFLTGLLEEINKRLSGTVSPVVDKLKIWRKNYRLVDDIVREDGKVRKEGGSFFINPEGPRVRKRAMSLLMDEIGIPSQHPPAPPVIVKVLQSASRRSASDSD